MRAQFILCACIIYFFILINNANKILINNANKIYLTRVFSSLDNVLILLCIIFLTLIYVLSVTVLTLWVAPPEMFYSWYRI